MENVMRKFISVVGVVAACAVVLGTANAQNPIVPRAAPTTVKVPPSPPPAGTIGYGALGGGMTYKVLAIASWYRCNNDLFGDPAPNQKKACYAGNVKLADEGQMMTTPGPECTRVNVKYTSVNGVSNQRNLCPGRNVKCNNNVFGDPAYGIVKHCAINGKTIAEENGLFIVPQAPACLCGGKSINELNNNTNYLDSPTQE
jgi:hypothetical protein